MKTALTFALLVLSVFMYYRYRNERKKTASLDVKNKTLIKQNHNLAEANQTKQKLLAILAHDLINPFNAILGYTNLLEQDYHLFSDKEKQELIAIINKYSNQNYNFVKSLLDWTKTQNNKFSVTKTILNVEDIVQYAIKVYRILADKKKLHTQLRIKKNTTIYADKACLKIIILNLYGNAIKFSKNNSLISITSYSNQFETIIIIKDRGLGMTQQQIDNLFNIKTTKITKGTDNEKGIGLGLIICKELTQLQNAKLIVTSQINDGTTVSISFPNRL